jgi:hypothetical protein
MWEEAHHLASKYMDPIEVSHPRKKGILWNDSVFCSFTVHENKIFKLKLYLYDFQMHLNC